AQLSLCDGPPGSQIQMTDLPRWVPLLACRAVPGEAIACSLNSSASVNPPSPSAPPRKMSLREMPGLHSVAGPRSVSIGNASVDTGRNILDRIPMDALRAPIMRLARFGCTRPTAPRAGGRGQLATLVAPALL